MILPHYYAEYISREINLNDEYFEYKWVNINELKTFEPKIPNIPETVETLQRLKPLMKDEEFQLI